jgi:diguanylate cyclase (GGDEF)-like protein
LVAHDRIPAKDRSWYWIEANLRPCRDSDQQPDGVVASFRTVDMEVETERELNRRARTDELTGPLNRRGVLQRIEELTPQSRRGNDGSAALVRDRDDFTTINDSHGHGAGDDVLAAVALRIRGCLRADDLAARIGGEALLVVLRRVRDLEDTMAFAGKISAAAGVPIHTRVGIVTVTLSNGMTLSRSEKCTNVQLDRDDAANSEAMAHGLDRVIPIMA